MCLIESVLQVEEQRYTFRKSLYPKYAKQAVNLPHLNNRSLFKKNLMKENWSSLMVERCRTEP